MTSHGITCGDLAIPANVSLEEEANKVCVTVVAPKAAGEAVAEEAAAEEAAESTVSEAATEE